jgi:hypothetical protein
VTAVRKGQQAPVAVAARQALVAAGVAVARADHPVILIAVMAVSVELVDMDLMLSPPARPEAMAVLAATATARMATTEMAAPVVVAATARSVAEPVVTAVTAVLVARPSATAVPVVPVVQVAMTPVG